MTDIDSKKTLNLKPKYRTYEFNHSKWEYFNKSYKQFEDRKVTKAWTNWQIKRFLMSKLELEEVKYRPHKVPYMRRMGLIVLITFIGKTFHICYERTLIVYFWFYTRTNIKFVKKEDLW